MVLPVHLHVLTAVNTQPPNSLPIKTFVLLFQDHNHFVPFQTALSSCSKGEKAAAINILFCIFFPPGIYNQFLPMLHICSKRVVRDTCIVTVHALLFKISSIKYFPPFSLGRLLTVASNL